MTIRRNLTSAAPIALCTSLTAGPRYCFQVIVWALCIQQHLPAGAFEPRVYFAGQGGNDVEAWLSALGVTVRRVGEVVPGIPHCSRIAPLFDVEASTRPVIVTDSDVYIVDDPRVLIPENAGVCAVANYSANPPGRIFRKLFDALDFPVTYRPSLALIDEQIQETHANNINAGLIVVPSAQARSFAERWRHWSTWLFQHRELLERWHGNIDQIAFALTCEERDLNVSNLAPQINLFLHLINKVETLYALHLSANHMQYFTSRFDAAGLIRTDGLQPDVAAAIGRVNSCLAQALTIALGMPSARAGAEEHIRLASGGGAG